MSGVVSKRYRRPKIKITFQNSSKGRKTFYLNDNLIPGDNHPQQTNSFTSIPVEPQANEVPPTSDYMARRLDTVEEWGNIRSSLVNAFTESMTPPSCPKCISCLSSLEDKYIVCNDCAANTIYCQECCLKVHQFVRYHKPTIWLVCVIYIKII